jgi:hypothetical protein
MSERANVSDWQEEVCFSSLSWSFVGVLPPSVDRLSPGDSIWLAMAEDDHPMRATLGDAVIPKWARSP